MPEPKSKYPECDKLRSVAPVSNEIGSFLDWLRDEYAVVLGKWVAEEDRFGRVKRDRDGDALHVLAPAPFGLERLLAEYFEIDLDKVETERRQILEDLQKPKPKKSKKKGANHA